MKMMIKIKTKNRRRKNCTKSANQVFTKFATFVIYNIANLTNMFNPLDMKFIMVTIRGNTFHSPMYIVRFPFHSPIHCNPNTFHSPIHCNPNTLHSQMSCNFNKYLASQDPKSTSQAHRRHLSGENRDATDWDKKRVMKESCPKLAWNIWTVKNYTSTEISSTMTDVKSLCIIISISASSRVGVCEVQLIRNI